mmetsp:Transcript_63724/g.176033  ORF Transcript_63724/g.176033 Transcript_63724/m.176033 type:complete len:388 (+) Transcript_63724:250-1413(+)
MSTRKPTLMTTTMKDRAAERNGARRTVYGVRANNKYHEEVRMNGGRGSTEFPFKGGDTYVGEWANNVEEGFGTKTWVKGHKYEGEWMAGMRHGKGTFWVKEGGRLRKQYAGDWQNDQRHGQGIFMMANGDKFEGEWMSNERHGAGVIKYADGSDCIMYDGSWANGKRTGLGVLTMANGDRYEGHWLDDKKEGPGRYFYRSTSKVYEGEWVDDIPKCGEFKEAPPGSFDDFPVGGQADANPFTGAAASNSAGVFALPDLKLIQPDSVVTEAVATIRQQRAKDLGAPGLKVFESNEIQSLKKIFAAYDERDTGFVTCGDLLGLLQAAGVNVTPSTVEDLVLSLEADSATQLTFAEFVDIAALLMDAEGYEPDQSAEFDFGQGDGQDTYM